MVKFISSDKSKSCLVIPTKQISGSPHNGSTLTCLTNVIICGNSLKLFDDLNLEPLN